MRVVEREEKEVPDNTVFWSIVSIVSVFVVVLATVMVIRHGTSTGQIVQQWPAPVRPFSANELACLDVPRCGGDQSFMCCAEQPLSNGMKCTAPLWGFGQESQPRYGYDNYGAGNPVCPAEMPYRCACPEKFQYRQTWAVPSR